MTSIVSRTAADLPPPPSSLTRVALSYWTGIRVHHTGSPFTSWRNIHDWQTAGRPRDQRLAYIGYSFGISDGKVYELRGWDIRPAHDFINTTLGVCFGGNYETARPTAADLDALVWLVGEVRRRTGRNLPVDGHRDAPRASTACPGRHLYAQLPTIRRRADEEDDMPTAEEIAYAVWNRFNPTLNLKYGEILRYNLNAIRPDRQQTEGAVLGFRRDLARIEELAEAAVAAHSGGGHEEILARVDAHHAERMAALDAMDATLDALPSAVADELGDRDGQAVAEAVARALARVRVTVDDE